MSEVRSMKTFCQVDDEHGSAGVILDVELTPGERDLLDALLEPLTRDQQLYLLTSLVRAKVDEEAYERVCRDRGLLL